MALLNRYNSVPANLPNKEFALVKTDGGFKWYVGDENNLPVPSEDLSGETAASIKTKYESNVDTNAFTDALLNKLNSITAIFTDTLKSAYDTASSWVSNNGQNVLNHLTKWATPATAGKMPRTLANGDIEWIDTPSGTGDTTNLAKLNQANNFVSGQIISSPSLSATEFYVRSGGNDFKVRLVPDTSARIIVEFWNKDICFLRHTGQSTGPGVIELSSTPIGLVGTATVNTYTKRQRINAFPDLAFTLASVQKNHDASFNIDGNGGTLWAQLTIDPNALSGSDKVFVIMARATNSAQRFVYFRIGTQTFFTLQNKGFGQIDYLTIAPEIHITGIQNLSLTGLGEYADDSSAGAGGVPVGYAYVNSTTGAVHKRRT